MKYIWITRMFMVAYVMEGVLGHTKKCDEIRNLVRKELTAMQHKHGKLLSEVEHLKHSVNTVAETMRWQIPLDCSQARSQGRWTSITLIAPPNMSPREVQCDQKTEGGGWTVVVSRSPEVYNALDRNTLYESYTDPHSSSSEDGFFQPDHTLLKPNFGTEGKDLRSSYDDFKKHVNFNRSWAEYKKGFGSPHTEYWIGNAVLHALTKEISWEAIVLVEAWDGSAAVGHWDHFRVHGESEKFKLEIDGYRKDLSTLDDGLTYHNSVPFSTYDSDNDNHRVHCSRKYGGGWWFHQCHVSHLTGTHLEPGEHGEHAVHWLPWRRNKESLRSVKLMIKPKFKQ